MEASWKPLGLLSEATGAKNSALEQLLGAPGRIPRQFSASVGSTRRPERSPGGSKIELERRLEPKSAKPQNSMNVSQNSFIFEVPRRPFGGPRSKSMQVVVSELMVEPQDRVLAAPDPFLAARDPILAAQDPILAAQDPILAAQGNPGGRVLAAWHPILAA